MWMNGDVVSVSPGPSERRAVTEPECLRPSRYSEGCPGTRDRQYCTGVTPTLSWPGQQGTQAHGTRYYFPLLQLCSLV